MAKITKRKLAIVKQFLTASEERVVVGVVLVVAVGVVLTDLMFAYAYIIPLNFAV